MKRFGSRKMTGGALVLALVLGAVVAVASAQAAPSKKKFDAYVAAANAGSTSFTVTLANDTSSQQTLGSADFSAPGLSIQPISQTAVTTSLGHSWTVCTGSGGVACGDGANNVVEFRADSSGEALLPGEKVSFLVSAGHAGCTNATWVATAKQSNDYSGTNNLFNLAANDLTPLGGFTTNSIASIIDRSVTPTVAFTASAKDTCGNAKTDYNGTTFPYTGTTLAYTGLTGATPAASTGLTWTGGTGSITVTPKSSEIGNQFTITDTTSGISASSLSDKADLSNTFDIVDELCTSTNPNLCKVDDHAYQNNGKAQTFASTPNPSTGYIGLGFNNNLPDCSPGSTDVGSVVLIDPSADLPGYQLTITYTKAAAAGAHPQDVIFCLTKDNGQNWTVLSNCSNSVAPPCVASRSGTTGGGLQFVLSLPAGDPGAGGHI